MIAQPVIPEAPKTRAWSPLGGDKGMPNGRLYDREGMATMGRQNLEKRWVEKLACHYLCVLAFSNRCSKDSSRAHKGLVTNWPHHSALAQIASNKV